MVKVKMGNVTQRWVDVLKPFASDYSARRTATELSRLSGIPQQTVSRIMNHLVKLNLVSYSYEGKNKSFYLDRNKLTTGSLFVVLEGSKAIEFGLDFPRQSLVIGKMLDYCEGIVLFGSYASGNPKRDSDLDVVFVGKCDRKKMREIIRASPFEVHEHFVSCSEFRKNILKKTAISIEILNNHVLFGDFGKVVNVFLEGNGKS